jgi:hypothetical protein
MEADARQIPPTRGCSKAPAVGGRSSRSALGSPLKVERRRSLEASAREGPARGGGQREEGPAHRREEEVCRRLARGAPARGTGGQQRRRRQWLGRGLEASMGWVWGIGLIGSGEGLGFHVYFSNLYPANPRL